MDSPPYCWEALEDKARAKRRVASPNPPEIECFLSIRPIPELREGGLLAQFHPSERTFPACIRSQPGRSLPGVLPARRSSSVNRRQSGRGSPCVSAAPSLRSNRRSGYPDRHTANPRHRIAVAGSRRESLVSGCLSLVACLWLHVSRCMSLVACIRSPLPGLAPQTAPFAPG